MKLYREISNVPFSFIMLSNNNLYLFINNEMDEPEKIKFEKFIDD